MIKALPRFYEGYRLDLLLGKTENSETYKAASNDNEYVVLKVVRDEARDVLAVDSQRTLQDVDGVPNVVRQKQTTNQTLIATEYIPGRSLEDLLSFQKLEVRKAIKVTLALVVIIDNAHKAGVPHGDVSSTNVILSEGDQVVLTDFKRQNSDQALSPKKRRFIDMNKIGELFQLMLGEELPSVAIQQILERTKSDVYFDRYSSSSEMLKEIDALFSASHLSADANSKFNDAPEYCHDPLLFKGMIWGASRRRIKAYKAPSECRSIQMFPQVEVHFFDKLKNLLRRDQKDRPHSSIHESVDHLRTSLKQMHYQILFACSKAFGKHSSEDLERAIKEFNAGLNPEQQLAHGQDQLTKAEEYLQRIEAFIKNLSENKPMIDQPEDLVDKFSYKNDIDRMFEERMTRLNIVIQAKQERNRAFRLIEFHKNLLDRLKKRMMKVQGVIEALQKLVDAETQLTDLLSSHNVDISLSELLEITFAKVLSPQQAYMLVEDLRKQTGTSFSNEFYCRLAELITHGIYEQQRTIAELAGKLSIDCAFPIPSTSETTGKKYTIGV